MQGHKISMRAKREDVEERRIQSVSEEVEEEKSSTRSKAAAKKSSSESEGDEFEVRNTNVSLATIDVFLCFIRRPSWT